MLDATTGSNTTGDGSSVKPWKTITYALGRMTGKGRHIIHVAAGAYNTSLGEVFPITMVDSVSLVGAGKEVTIIDANSSNYVISCSGILVLDPEVRIEGFKITGGKSAGPGGIYITAGSALLITNNLITANRAEGNYSGGAVHIVNSSPRIENNLITSNHGVEINKGASIYITGATSAPLISGNFFTGNINDLNTGGGTIGTGTVVIDGSSGVKVQNNIFLDNDPGGESWGRSSGEIYIYNCSPSIKYNLIAKSSGNGIYVSYTTSKPTIINNTISDNAYDGINLYAAPDSIFNNIISYNSGYGIYEYHYNQRS